MSPLEMSIDKFCVNKFGARCNVALMLSHEPGRAIADFFADRSLGNVVAVYFEEEGDYAAELAEKLGISRDRAFHGKEVLSNLKHIEWLKEQNVDFLITVYWPWLLDKAYLCAADDSINFHPALLPVNRGWYPHVHSIVDESPAGVTLHKITEGADEGDIWVQKKLEIPLHETAKSIYLKLQDEIVSLFKQNWRDISSGKIVAFAQDHDKSSYHAKKELAKLDKVDFDELSARGLFNLLRARSFGEKGFAYFEAEGLKYFLNLKITPESPKSG